MDEINRIPVVKNMIQENRPIREDADEDINKLPHLKEYYKNLEDPAVQMEFENLLFPLEKMGYKQKLIFRSFIVFRYKDIAEGIDLLSKNNSTWNHKFIPGFKNKCFVCDDLEKNHIGFTKNKPESEDEHEYFERKDLLRPINIGSEKINEALKRMKTINYNINTNINKINEIKIESGDSETCPICFLEFEENNKIILGCNHKFCKDCIVIYLEEEIKNSRVDPIKCPEKKCFNAKPSNYVSNNTDNNLITIPNSNLFIFSEDLIKSLVSSQYYEKYLDFKVKVLIEKDKNLTFCPIPNCKGYAKIDSSYLTNSSKCNSKNLIEEEVLQQKSKNNDSPPSLKKSEINNNTIEDFNNNDFNEDDRLLAESQKKKNNAVEQNTILNVSLEAQMKKKLVCNFKHEFCYRCKNAWNENHCCEKDEELFKYSNENANKLKKCPNCRTWIEKNRGCNHMTCFVCKYEFCWLCMKECLPDHYNILGSECYGKQFPEEEMDPQIREAINDLQNASSFFFIFRITFFSLSYLHRVYFNPNPNHVQNLNNNNNNVQNNNNNNNDGNLNIEPNVENEINVNQNHEVLEIRDPNEDIHNAIFMDRENRGRNKCGFFTIIFIVLFILWFIMLFLNGVLLFSMFKSLTTISPALIHNQAVVNRLRSATCLILGSYFVIWFVFFLPGVFITTFWFIISVLYLIWLMISR